MEGLRLRKNRHRGLNRGYSVSFAFCGMGFIWSEWIGCSLQILQDFFRSDAFSKPMRDFANVVSMKVMALQACLPSPIFYELGMGGLSAVKADFHVLVTMDAKSRFYQRHPFSIVFAVTVVAFMWAYVFPLLSIPRL